MFFFGFRGKTKTEFIAYRILLLIPSHEMEEGKKVFGIKERKIIKI